MSHDEAEGQEFMRICEVARMLRVSPDSVRRWVRRGQIEGVLDRPSGRYLIPRAAVLARLEAVQPVPDLRQPRLCPQTADAALDRWGLR